MPAWYPLRLDPWQLSLKYLNLATELPSDLVYVAQLVRAWQAICQVVGLSPFLSHFLDLTDGESVPRIPYRILSWGWGKQDGSRMIVACESTLTHVSVCVPTRGVWGHAPPEGKI